MSTTTTTSVVQMWNRALQRIGETIAIQDVDDKTASAEACRTHYGDCLVSVLELFHWPFATKQAQLNYAVREWDNDTTYAAADTVRYNGAVYSSVQAANTSHDPSTDDGTWWAYAYGLAVGWDYVYALPSDFVSFMAFITSIGDRYEKESFEIMSNGIGDGQVLATDMDEDDFSVLEYTGVPGVRDGETGELIENPAVYSRQFVGAVCWLLASELALAIKKDQALSEQMLARFERSTKLARANAMNSVVEIPENETPSISVRSF